MSILKKASAGLLCAAMTVTLASCNLGGPDSSYAAVIDGQKIPAGVFISMQMNAYYDAMSYIDPIEATAETTAATVASDPAQTVATTTTTTPFADKTIEGKGVREWINDEATTEMQKYAAIEAKFSELGLTFNDNEPKQVELYIDSLWEYYGEMYEGYGIAKSSINLVTLNSEKKSLIFNYYYGEGGEKAVSEDELKQYLTENNARINYMAIELKDSEGNLLKSEGKEGINKKAEEYIERAKNGESFDAIIREYEESLKTTESTDDSSEETAATEETSNTVIITKDGVTPDSTVVDKVFGGTVSAGDYFTVESTNGETLYVVQYLDLFTDPEYFETNKLSALTALKGEEFDAEIENWITTQTVERNQAAYNRYKYEKFEG